MNTLSQTEAESSMREICIRLGLCLQREDINRIKESSLTNIEQFIDAIYDADRCGPETRQKLRGEMRKIAAKYFKCEASSEIYGPSLQDLIPPATLKLYDPCHPILGISEDDALQTAENWATTYETELGRCLCVWHQRDTTFWDLFFAINLYCPEWCYMITIGDNGEKIRFEPTRRVGKLKQL